jgi:hypothetical protein
MQHSFPGENERRALNGSHNSSALKVYNEVGFEITELLL